MNNDRHYVLFISGLPGAGKSTVSRVLAEKLNWLHIDADDFVSEDMQEKTKTGELLSDDELDTWVTELFLPKLLEKHTQGSVVAAGLLARPKYVERFSKDMPGIVYVNLEVPYEILLNRIQQRENHFAGKAILEKCWAMKNDFVLPGPEVDGTLSPEEVASEIISLIN